MEGRNAKNVQGVRDAETIPAGFGEIECFEGQRTALRIIVEHMCEPGSSGQCPYPVCWVPAGQCKRSPCPLLMRQSLGSGRRTKIASRVTVESSAAQAQCQVGLPI